MQLPNGTLFAATVFALIYTRWSWTLPTLQEPCRHRNSPQPWARTHHAGLRTDRNSSGLVGHAQKAHPEAHPAGRGGRMHSRWAVVHSGTGPGRRGRGLPSSPALETVGRTGRAEPVGQAHSGPLWPRPIILADSSSREVVWMYYFHTKGADMSGSDYYNRRTAELREQRERAMKTFVERVDSAREVLQKRLERLDLQAAELATRSEDLVVLVRKTPGPAVTTYHFADGPCGRVTGQARSRASFEQQLEGEAVKRGLQRCSACSWPRARAAAWSDQELESIFET